MRARERNGRISPGHIAGRHEDRPVVGFSPWGARFRLRVATYVVLVAIPAVAISAWAFDRLAAQSKVDEVDSALRGELHASVGQLRAAAEERKARATRLAMSRRVQEALAGRDLASLRRITVETANTAFLSPRGALLAGEVEPLSLSRSVDVVAGGRTLGRVLASLPFSDEVLARLEHEAGVSAGDRLVIVQTGRIVRGPAEWRGSLDLSRDRPTDVRLGGVSYRVLSTAILPVAHLDLAVLRPKKSVDGMIADTRKRVVIIALVSLLLVASIAYALAPAIARGRFMIQQRAQAARALAHVADGVFLLDPNGRIRSWNPAAEAITGLPAGAVRGRRAGEVIPDWPEIAQLVPVARGPGPSAERARPRTVPLELAGRELWVSISGVEFSEGTVYAFRDVTEERKLEELRTHFVATVSHELRTPLAGIYGAAMTLRRRGIWLAEEQRDHLLAIVADQSERLAHIVDDILLASQLDSGTLSIAEESFDAAELAKGVVDAARVRLPDNLSIDLRAPSSLVSVAGDSDKARQILANLLDNAVKYSPEGGGIEVQLERRNGRALFIVRDEGLGIPASEHEHVFEKFYRVDPTMSRGVGGTGLGLFICRELVHRMGGRIWVDSELGAGSSFSFELPVAERHIE
jgi:PAS domain S-box-containing protein